MTRFLMRLFGVLRKETLQILRDPSSIILALVMPMVLLVIFGYGVSLDAEHIPMVLVNHDKGPIVITSYSIHYTKLYDPVRGALHFAHPYLRSRFRPPGSDLAGHTPEHSSALLKP